MYMLRVSGFGPLSYVAFGQIFPASLFLAAKGAEQLFGHGFPMSLGVDKDRHKVLHDGNDFHDIVIIASHKHVFATLVEDSRSVWELIGCAARLFAFY